MTSPSLYNAHRRGAMPRAVSSALRHQHRALVFVGSTVRSELHELGPTAPTPQSKVRNTFFRASRS